MAAGGGAVFLAIVITIADVYLHQQKASCVRNLPTQSNLTNGSIAGQTIKQSQLRLDLYFSLKSRDSSYSHSSSAGMYMHFHAL